MPTWIPAPLRLLGQRLRHEPPADTTLADNFQDRATERGYTLSDGQRRVITAMAAQLAAFATGQARSLYLYGAVGRGKSWLLDGFFQAVPTAVGGDRRFVEHGAGVHHLGAGRKVR
ncbi:MAG: cell division protein ZapE, partial [Pseudomonas sp.]|nr:cell division protein ZapE [Pseudomonas sp.]